MAKQVLALVKAKLKSGNGNAKKVASSPIHSAEDAVSHPCVIEAIRRNIIEIDEEKNAVTVTYRLHNDKTYNFKDPEEWVRAVTVSWLVVERDYPANRMKLEVRVPRRTPNDLADIVVYQDDACKKPYLVVENKEAGISAKDRDQGIEQLFGNANSLSIPLALYDDSTESILFDRANFDPTERKDNRLGTRNALPKQYGDIPKFALVAGSDTDIKPVATNVLESKNRRAHSAIWSGGKRDPLKSFDEWSKLLFAKVIDERTSPDGQPRRFQVGTKETGW